MQPDLFRHQPRFDSGAELTTAEEWRAIPETNGHYEASSLGRIRSMWLRRGKGNGESRRRTEPKILRQYVSPSNGYAQVRFANVGPTLHVHRLVLLTFHGEAPSDKPCAGHKDGTRTNNAAANLEWVSYSENNGRDRHRHGTATIGSRNPASKLTEETVREMRRVAAESEFRRGGFTFGKLGAMFGISGCVAHKIVRRRTWTHVS